MAFLEGKRIVVTGGAGFLGREVCTALKAFRPSALAVPRSSKYDLRCREQIVRMLDDFHPHVVVHLAAVAGGIGANRDQPGRFFYENAIMGVELLEQCRSAGVEKVVSVGSVCAYPKLAPAPFREEDLWNGYPEETNAPYGLAKKMLLVQSQAYRQQYGLNAINLLPANLYGPRDNFEPATSHVIPALIDKVVTAQRIGARGITAWGSGTASREFLFVGDAAEAVARATELYNGADPVNVGCGQEITIRALAELICELAGFDGEIEWDASQPDGQPRRRLDVSRAKREFGFSARTPLRRGLRETITWRRLQQNTHRRAACAA